MIDETTVLNQDEIVSSNAEVEDVTQDAMPESYWYDDAKLKKFAPGEGETEADSIDKLKKAYLALEEKMSNGRLAPRVPDQYTIDTSFDFENENGVRITNMLSAEEIDTIKNKARSFGLDNDQCIQLYDWFNANKIQLQETEKQAEADHLQNVEEIYEEAFGKQGSWERQDAINKIQSGVDLCDMYCDGIDKTTLEKEVQSLKNSGFSEVLKCFKTLGGDIKAILDKNNVEAHNKGFYGSTEVTAQNTDTETITKRLRSILAVPISKRTQDQIEEFRRLRKEINL